MSANMQGLLSRLRGIEKNGKDTDLADYLEGLMDERDSNAHVVGKSSSSLTKSSANSRSAPSSSSRRKPGMNSNNGKLRNVAGMEGEWIVGSG